MHTHSLWPSTCGRKDTEGQSRVSAIHPTRARKQGGASSPGQGQHIRDTLAGEADTESGGACGRPCG